MVDKFIQNLKNICQECFDEQFYTDNHNILFLGLVKLIDGVSRKSKSEMREKYLEFMKEYNQEDSVFFEIYPRYKEMNNLNLNYLSGAEKEVYLLKPNYNGLNVSFDLFRKLDDYFIEAICNWKFVKKLYSESECINGESLNFFNISSYDLSSFSNVLAETSGYDKLEKIINDYFKGFDIKTFILLSLFEGDIFLKINNYDIFKKLDNIQIDESIYTEDKFRDFLSQFIIKTYCDRLYNDNILFNISLINMERINELESNVYIPSNNSFSIIIHFIYFILYKKSFNYDLKVFTELGSFSYIEKILLSLIENIKVIDEVSDELLNSINLVYSNDNINDKIFNHFKKEDINSIALVSSYPYLKFNFENFKEILINDNLDSIFLLENHDPVLILNSNKIEERLDKFLLFYGLDNTHIGVEVDFIVDTYKFFKESKYSKLFYNEFIDNDSYKNHFNLSNLMYDKFRKVHNINYENTLKRSFDNDEDVYCLGDMANLKSIDVKNKIEDGILYINKKMNLKESLIMVPDLDSNWVFSKEKIRKSYEIGENSNNLLLCTIKSKNILGEYLYYYLNSDKGISDLGYFKRNGNKNVINDLKYIRIPIPSIEIQKKVIDTAKTMDIFFNNMEIFKKDFNKNILDYEPASRALSEFTCQIKFDESGSIDDMCSNWRVVYNGVFWPLAITYLYATKKSDANLNKKELYIGLFEFFAAFNVIILLSAIPYYKQDAAYEKIWNGFRLDNMTFGGWVTLYEKLNDFYKSEEFDTDIDKSILMEISSDKYYNLFNELNPRRNRYKGHNAIIREDKEKKLVEAVEKLEAHIDDMVQIMKSYSNLKMYYVTGDNDEDEDEGIIKQELLILNGPCNPQFYYYITLNLEDKLDSKNLYLYDSSRNSFLKINKDLMKLFKDENSEEWMLYLFDGYNKRKKKNKSKYKCHQKFEYFKNLKDGQFLIELKEFLEN